MQEFCCITTERKSLVLTQARLLTAHIVPFNVGCTEWPS